MDGPEECNRAVLVSVATFDSGVPLEKRSGANRDAKKLHRILTKLGYKVELHMDPSSKEIYNLFSEESRRPVKDCFLAVLSSHGEEGCVFGSDGKPVRLSRVFTYFDNECMEKKTKLFLIQACRGGALDDGVEVDSSVSRFPPYLSVPVDTAVMFATSPGYGAFMNLTGSVFLQSFCSLLEEQGHSNLELTKLMTRLSHRVAYTFEAKGRKYDGKKEMPCLLTRLTRDVFPFAETEKDRNGERMSATSLVVSQNVRQRIVSLS
ncbi:caspase-3-like [Xiphophorus couchianus]|uniref:Caspase-3-like n=1 Tax=Xiphophorus couchianus TaxID=32473 RepID=A0A3B5MQT1_9TELE|nr:caspase-3-like [Xiphophorus couchianus]